MRGMTGWIVALIAVAIILVGSTLLVKGNFGGTDVLVTDVAGQLGAQAKTPLINTDQGMLHWFFGAGALVAGFTIGYFMKRLGETGDDERENTGGLEGVR